MLPAFFCALAALVAEPPAGRNYESRISLWTAQAAGGARCWPCLILLLGSLQLLVACAACLTRWITNPIFQISWTSLLIKVVDDISTLFVKQ